MERFEEELAAKEFGLIQSLLAMPFGEEAPKLITNRAPPNGAEEDKKDGRKAKNETTAHMNNETDVVMTGGKKDDCIATSDDNHPERPLRKEDILWHEPPNMNYSKFEVYNDVQKEFSSIGGEDLGWRSKWADLSVQYNLFFEYRSWSEAQQKKEGISQKNRRFYKELENNLRIDELLHGYEEIQFVQSRTADELEELMEIFTEYRRKKMDAS